MIQKRCIYSEIIKKKRITFNLAEVYEYACQQGKLPGKLGFEFSR